MDREIQRVGSFFLAGFAVLALACGYWQVWQGPTLAVAPGNPRVLEAERRAQRGAILDRAGLVLVQSEGGRRVSGAAETAHVTGYFSYRYGRTGLERAYHGVLSGREGVPPQRRSCATSAGPPGGGHRAHHDRTPGCRPWPSAPSATRKGRSSCWTCRRGRCWWR